MSLAGKETQFALYDELSAGAETWKPDHHEAMFCRDIEEAISIGLAILSNIDRRRERWVREVETGKIPFDWAQAEEHNKLYKWWLERSARVLKAVELCESKHYKVDSADRFRQMNLDVSLMSLDTSRNKSSLESIQSGSGIPSKQAMDELRHSLRSRRT